MQVRGGMSELMRQAARMQRKIEDKKKELEGREVSATAVGDKIKATATFGGRLSRIEIDPEFVKAEGLEMALDAAVAAINGALDAADKGMEAEITKITGGVKIPGAV